MFLCFQELGVVVIKKNDRGFSLVELMIVIGLLGGVAMLVMNITKQSTKSSAKLEFDTDVTLTTNEINAILSNQDNCLATFGTATPNSIVAKVIPPAAPTLYKYYISAVPPGDQGYGNSRLKITSYTLTGTAPDGVLTILYQNKNILKGSSGRNNISKKINIYIAGAPGAITKCRSLSTSTTDIWTRGTATDANNVFYNGGVRVGDETQTNTCDPTTEGTQRYNKATHSMQYCGYNAGPPVAYAWRTLGGGSGLTSCPAGMIMVGDSGKHATYCIDANARAASTYNPAAVSTCYSVNDSTAGRAHVCDFSEWNTACVKGLASSMTGHWEWVSPFRSAASTTALASRLSG